MNREQKKKIRELNIKKQKALKDFESKIHLDNKEYHALQYFLKTRNEKDLQVRVWAELDFMTTMGLCLVYAYFCKRCNYVWFPRDFDPIVINVIRIGENIFYKKPPKVCARCKSRYWNSEPQKQTKHCLKPKYGFDAHDMLTKPRMLAVQRNFYKEKDRRDRAIAEIDRAEKEFREKTERFGIESRDQIPLENPILNKKKKRKISL